MKTFRLFTSEVIHSYVDVEAETAYDAEVKLWHTDTSTWKEILRTNLEILETLEFDEEFYAK